MIIYIHLFILYITNIPNLIRLDISLKFHFSEVGKNIYAAAAEHCVSFTSSRLCQLFTLQLMSVYSNVLVHIEIKLTFLYTGTVP